MARKRPKGSPPALGYKQGDAAPAVPPAPPAHLAPTPVGERLAALDILRGFALFGVLFVNVQLAFRSAMERYELSAHPWPGMLNAVVDDLRLLFFDGKFMSLFSMLFGAGLALQLSRAEARGASFGPFVFRRMGALLLFGALHIALFWWGDILHVYAVAGVVSLFFARRSPLTVFVWALGFLALPLVAFTIMMLAQGQSPPAPNAAELDKLRAVVLDNVAGYSAPGWLAVAKHRIHDYLRQAPQRGGDVPFAFTSFLLGMAAHKAGILRAPEQHRGTLKRALVVALCLGLPMTAMRYWGQRVPLTEPSWARRIGFMVTPTSMIVLGVAYAAGLLLFLSREKWRARLSFLAYPGRMALSNYLAQSVVNTFVFYGFGLGLYDKMTPAGGALLALTLYAVQILLSYLWLSRFQFGPVEWLWRSLTYGAMQPWRKRAGH